MSEPERRDRPSDKRLRGALLMTWGGLMVAVCGGCTLAYVTVICRPLCDEFGELVPFFGGIPIALGIAIFVVGLHQYRKN